MYSISQMFRLMVVMFFFYAIKVHAVIDPVDYAKAMIVKPNNTIRALLIVPEDKVDQVLLGLIKSEQYSIVMMEFRITSKKFEDALKEELDRGVKVYIITDESCFGEK